MSQLQIIPNYVLYHPTLFTYIVKYIVIYAKYVSHMGKKLIGYFYMNAYF